MTDIKWLACIDNNMNAYVLPRLFKLRVSSDDSQ